MRSALLRTTKVHVPYQSDPHPGAAPTCPPATSNLHQLCISAQSDHRHRRDPETQAGLLSSCSTPIAFCCIDTQPAAHPVALFHVSRWPTTLQSIPRLPPPRLTPLHHCISTQPLLRARPQQTDTQLLLSSIPDPIRSDPFRFSSTRHDTTRHDTTQRPAE